MKWDVDWTDFQSEFLLSTARFPNMTSAWGTGKTMAAIGKGVTLSGLYPGNKGLILRKNMTDLRDSTMADFVTYTGLKVKVQSKTCIIVNGKGYPSSDIIFHHVDELAGIIQNINLGWFLVEQGEELDTDDVFEKLGGRLRRVLTPRREVQQQLIEIGCLDRIVDDFRLLGYEERIIAESALITKLCQPLRQGFIIANANGHNWNWRKFINPGSPEYIVGRKFTVKSKKTGKVYDYGNLASLVQATTFDNAENLPADFLASLEIKKETAPSHYRRFVLNSHEDMDTADKVIPYQKILDAVDRNLRDYGYDTVVISCDPAEFGDDKTVIFVFKGLGIIDTVVLSQKSLMETAGHIMALHYEHHSQAIAIDDIGVGAGVRSRLKELNAPVVPINSGRQAEDSVRYTRLRDQMWMHAAQLFRDDYVSIPNDDILIEDLAAFTYGMNSKGQILVARKKDIKKLISRSPDRGDALVMGLWVAKKTKKRLPVMAGKMESKKDWNPLTIGL